MLDSVLLVVLILSGLGVGLGLFPYRDRAEGSRILVSGFIGFLALTFVYIILTSLGIANRTTTVLCVVVLGVLGYWRHTTRLRVGWESVVVVMGAFIVLPTLLQGLLMSGGAFPEVFFNVDTAFFMHSISGEAIECADMDTLVLAQGHSPDTTLEDALRDGNIEVHAAGDCRSPRSAEEAVYEGMMAGRTV